jgi:phosphatidylglycerol:prolipoprotein diacylglycerol transferase
MPISVLPYPAIDPVLVSIGPVAIRWYALSYICGILLGWLYARTIIANQRLWGGPAPFTAADLDDFLLWVTLGIILGGRTGYVLFYNFDFFITHPLEILQVWKGGMSFHGGFLGCVLAVVLFGLKRRISVLSLGDVTCTVAPIGVFFGRLANFVNSELWGRPTDVPWAMVFPSPEAGPWPRHPSQLYEAALEGVALFCLLRWATHRKHWLNRRGVVMGLFLAGYGLIRISLENVREPDSYMPSFPLGLTMGMMLSAPMVLIGAWLVWRGLKEPLPPAIEDAGAPRAADVPA